MNSSNATLFNGECRAAAALRVASSGGDEPANLVWLGILLGIAGSIGVNVGQNIQNAGWDAKGARGCTWRLTGLTIFVSFAIVNFIAFGFAPASVLSPLEGTQFVSNFLFNLWEGDEIVKTYIVRILTGTVLIAIGVTLPVLGSLDSPVANFDEEALRCMWGGTGWLVFAGCLILLAVCCTLAYIQMPNRPQPGKPKSRDPVLQTFYTIPSAVFGALGVINAKVISELIEILFTDITENDDWGFLSSWALWSSSVLAAIAAWALAYQFVERVRRWHAFGFVLIVLLALVVIWAIIITTLFSTWFLWTTIALIVIGLGGWANRLNEGPNKFPKLTIIPLMNGAYILLSSTAGALFFEEFQDMKWWGILMYFSGMAILLVGLVLIVPNVKDEDSPPETNPNVKVQTLLSASTTFRIGAGLLGVINYGPPQETLKHEMPALLFAR
jgi:hypothetical protein